MPFTTIDTKPALIVFDQQNYNRALPVDYVVPLDAVIERTVRLADAFRRQGWPVVFMKVPNAWGIQLMKEGTQPGGRVAVGYVRAPYIDADAGFPDGWDDIIEELTPHDGDLVITKPFWDSFIGTSLDYDLRQQGVDQVFVTGLMTHVGVESTCRSACNLGYNTVPITDAMTDFDADAYRNSVEKVFPRIGEPSTTEEVLAKIAERGPVPSSSTQAGRR